MKIPGLGREDDDDLFAHTRMSFGDHIEELRTRMIRAILGFLVAVVVGLFVGKPVLDFIQAPVRAQLVKFYDARIATEKEKVKAELDKMRDTSVDEVEKQEQDQKVKDEDRPILHVRIQMEGSGEWKNAQIRYLPPEFAVLQAKENSLFTRPASLTSLTITESFMTYIMVSIYCGIVLSSPWIFWQLWQFIAAGLYPHEKKYVHLYMPLSIGLFLGGCALAEFVVLPIGISYLLSFNEWLGVEPELRLSEWLSFAVMVPVVFGVAFQTPLVMLFLERVGIVKVDFYTKNRKMAIFVLAVVACLLAVAPDAFSMMSLAIPMWGLYELGIILCRFAPRPRPVMEEPDPEEMVEV